MTEQEIEQAFDKWQAERVGDSDPHWTEISEDLDSFRAGAKWAMEQMQKELDMANNQIKYLEEKWDEYFPAAESCSDSVRG